MDLRSPKDALRRALRTLGYEMRRIPPASQSDRRTYPLDFGPEEVALCRSVEGWTLTTPERIVALRDAVRYITEAGIPGAIAECGVWRGGSMQVVARTLVELSVADRDLYLFDTFEAMPEPGERDVDIWGRSAHDDWVAYQEHGDSIVDEAYSYKPFEEVRARLLACGYPAERMHFVKGLVEDTIPDQAPAELALLRLDTDFYASTRHELVHLMPRLAPGAVLIVDDYGQFRGAREAVDEYLAEAGLAVLLNRLDFSGRLVVIPSRSQVEHQG